MRSTLSPSILALTMGCSIAMEVWKVLENTFSSISRSHILNLKGELHNLKKGADFVDVYLQKIKVVKDKLLAICVIIDDDELFHITIKGLPREYNAFRSTIRTRSTLLSFNELSTLLNTEEESFNETLVSKDHVFAMATVSTSLIIISINSTEEEVEVTTTTIEVEEEVEVQAISHLILLNSHLFNKISPIPLLQVPDQKMQLAKFVVNLDT